MRIRGEGRRLEVMDNPRHGGNLELRKRAKEERASGLEDMTRASTAIRQHMGALKGWVKSDGPPAPLPSELYPGAPRMVLRRQGCLRAWLKWDVGAGKDLPGRSIARFHLPTCLTHRPRALTAHTAMHRSTGTIAVRPSELFRGNPSRTNEAVLPPAVEAAGQISRRLQSPVTTG